MEFGTLVLIVVCAVLTGGLISIPVMAYIDKCIAKDRKALADSIKALSGALSNHKVVAMPVGDVRAAIERRDVRARSI
jgi:hypothetical protein